MKDYLVNCIDDIPSKINSYIFKQEQVDLSHIYIDGTKITANASKYSWVWKKSSVKNRDKVFNKITELLNEINKITSMQGVKFEIRTEYAIEYMKQITEQYVELVCIKPECIVRGKGHRKTPEQRNYDMLVEYTEKLKKYAKHINICGESRNSYSKTDSDATFFRIKRDYMGNDQLLPGYNFQLGICVTFICKQLFLNTGGQTLFAPYDVYFFKLYFTNHPHPAQAYRARRYSTYRQEHRYTFPAGRLEQFQDLRMMCNR